MEKFNIQFKKEVIIQLSNLYNPKTEGYGLLNKELEKFNRYKEQGRLMAVRYKKPWKLKQIFNDTILGKVYIKDFPELKKYTKKQIQQFAREGYRQLIDGEEKHIEELDELKCYNIIMKLIIDMGTKSPLYIREYLESILTKFPRELYKTDTYQLFRERCEILIKNYDDNFGKILRR